MVAILSVSGGMLDSQCQNVVMAMKVLNIVGDVTPNVSVYNQFIENGCRILIAGKTAEEDTKKLWYHIRDVQQLSCAHAEFSKYESGCVFDVFAPSKCPSKV